jgi:transcription antitermination factor NusG
MGFSPYVATHPVRVKSPLKGAQAPVFTMVPRPMFFGFFFVRIDMDGFGWAKIRPAPADGIRRLLLTPALRPAPVRAGLIEALIDDEPRRLQMPDRALPKCAAGETVLVVRGPFAGQVVTVESCDGYTTVVWLNAFGGQTRTTLSRRDVSDE